ELGSQLGFHGQIRERFKDVAPVESGVVTCAAADDDQVARLLQPVEHGLETAKLGHSLAGLEAAPQSIFHSLGLLKDLFQHEMRERAAVDGLRSAFENRGFAAHGLVVESLDPEAASLNTGYFVVLEIHYLVRVLGEGRYV